jgi:hypothetical protein
MSAFLRSVERWCARAEKGLRRPCTRARTSIHLLRTHSTLSNSSAPTPESSHPKLVLRELLHPRTWKPSEDRSFILNAEQINELCDEAELIFRDEATVLQLQGAQLEGVWWTRGRF